jgi:hypothetical protein
MATILPFPPQVRAPAGACRPPHLHTPPKPAPLTFSPGIDPGEAYLGDVQFTPAQMRALLQWAARLAEITGDWTAADQIAAAMDGHTPEPPTAA